MYTFNKTEIPSECSAISLGGKMLNLISIDLPIQPFTEETLILFIQGEVVSNALYISYEKS